MQPDTDLLSPSFTTNTQDLSDHESGIARLMVTPAHLELVWAHMDAQGDTDKDKTLELFEGGYFRGNLVIESATILMAEKSLIEAHFGDRMSAHFFGKSPMVLSIAATILNPYDDSHKAAMVRAYKNVFRLYRVARIGIQPSMTFLGYNIPGAMLGLYLAEDSAAEGVIRVTFDWLIFKVLVVSTNNATSTATTSYTSIGDA